MAGAVTRAPSPDLYIPEQPENISDSEEADSDGGRLDVDEILEKKQLKIEELEDICQELRIDIKEQVVDSRVFGEQVRHYTTEISHLENTIASLECQIDKLKQSHQSQISQFECQLSDYGERMQALATHANQKLRRGGLDDSVDLALFQRKAPEDFGKAIDGLGNEDASALMVQTLLG